MPAEAVPLDAARTDPEVRWGMGDAVAGFVIANVLAVLTASVVLAASGRKGPDAETAALPLGLLFVLQLPLWLGYTGVSVYAAVAKGRGLVKDFKLRFKPIDIPIGIAVGVACQFLLVPALTWPLAQLLDKSNKDVEKVAQDLADKAHGVGGVILLLLMVAVIAPLVEELYFRGLVLRSIEKSWGAVLAIILSGVLFGVTHFELLQLPALVGFGLVLGLLVYKTDRLGTSMVAHVAFNSCTAILLLMGR